MPSNFFPFSSVRHSFLCIVIIFLVIPAMMSLSSFTVDAQAVKITPKSPGGTSSISALLITKNLYYNNKDLSRFVPYRHTSEELVNDPSDLIFVKDSFQSPEPFVYHQSVYNLTTAESVKVKTFLKNLPVVRNNLVVSFVATWDSSGRFPIDTSSWTLSQPSLLPYAFNQTSVEKCNISAVVKSLAAAVAVIPTSCQNNLVPGMKQRALEFPYCLLILAQSTLAIHQSCYGPSSETGKVLLTNFYCTDGAAAVDNTLCPYIKPWMPSGDPNAELVITIGRDGYPVAGRADQQPDDKANAGKLKLNLLFLVTIVVTVFTLWFY